MARLTDTSPEAGRVLAAAYRAMSPARKWQLIEQARRLARQLHDAGVRQRDPSAMPADLHRSWLRAVLGDRAGLVSTFGAEPMFPPTEQMAVVREVIAALDAMRVAHALGGSLASSIHGAVRQTHDADMAVEPFPGREAEFCAQLSPKYYVSLPAVIEANRQQAVFNVISPETAFKVDLFVRKDRPFDRSLMARRQTITLGDPPGFAASVVSPEDVILWELEWYRLGGEVSDRQWSDILSVLRVQGDRLDAAYLARWAGQLGVSDLLDRARSEASIEGV